MLNIKTFTCNPFGENCYLLWSDSPSGSSSPEQDARSDDSTSDPSAQSQALSRRRNSPAQQIPTAQETSPEPKSASDAVQAPLEGVLVDPGAYDGTELGQVRDYLFKENVRPKAIWLTHGHFDHVFGAASLSKEFGIPVLMSPADKEVLALGARMASQIGLKTPDTGFETVDIGDGDRLRVSGSIFTVIECPGHSPGSLCFYDEAAKVLLSGDTLFAGSIGRTDLPGGDYDKEIVSIMDRLMGLPGDVDVLPGHGRRTSIAEERTCNPFLQPFNEPEEESFGADGPLTESTDLPRPGLTGQ